MSAGVTIIDNTVLLPDPADWSSPPSWSLSWQTEEEAALRGNEGRNALRRTPRPTLTWTMLPRSIEDAASHAARLRAGFQQQAGRFCAPLHGRESWLSQPADAGANQLALDPTPWPWAVGDRLLVYDQTRRNVSIHQVTGVSVYALAINPVLPWALDDGAMVAPLFFGRLFAPDAASLITPDAISSPIRLVGDRFAISPTVPPCCASDLSLPFDFAVLRYIWTSGNGTDLDTRTAIVSPARNRDVGWARYAADPGEGILAACSVSDVPADTSGLYLAHGGDNCSAGVEALLLNLRQLALDNPGLSPLTIRLRAFWYSSRANGALTLQFATYLGGAMQHDGYDFTNVGGVQQQVIQVSRTLANEAAHSNVDGEECGSLVYDPATHTAQILAPA